ncbi:D-alanyl-D-alanine carboxypeptidase, partial [Candidatus Berkelbacteria bacterium]|nr:D-alanyl-D-alanine carboxypeptidase [Candidatus Berkelbacteria bacterium]
MKFRRILTVLLINALISTPAFIPTAKSTEQFVGVSQQFLEKLAVTNSYVRINKSVLLPTIYSKSYLLIDSTSAKIITSKNIHDLSAIASTTKMMTALLAREKYKLTETVTISSKAAKITGSKVNFIPNEQVSVGDLIKGLMIQSGNDAAYAL